LLTIAPRQVVATDRAVEKRIARKHHVLMQIARASGRVAGGVDRLYFKRSKVQHIAILNVDIDLWRVNETGHHLDNPRRWGRYLIRIASVCDKLPAKSILDRRNRSNVISVTVCYHNVLQRKSRLLHVFRKTITVSAGINNHRFAGLVVGQNVDVGSKRAESMVDEIHFGVNATFIRR
jgi:hypothetical protein